MRRLPPPGPGLLLLAAVVAGCSQSPPAVAPGDPSTASAEEAVPVLEPVPDAVEERVENPEEEAPAAGPVIERKQDASLASPAPTAPERDATVIAIAGTQPKPRTLWEAAVAARETRQQSPPARTSITDDNLHEFQDAEITFASPRPERAEGAKGDTGEASAEGTGPDEDPARDEAYWRSRVLDLRLRLRAAVDELAELDGRAADLRRSFYAADDPYVRDGEIKPAWDRALDRIGEVRREIVGLSEELEDVLEEGRQAGALPGWLREGIELEPEPDEMPRSRERAHEPGEPDVLSIEPPPVGPSAP